MGLEMHRTQRAPRLEHHHRLHTLLAVLPHVELQHDMMMSGSKSFPAPLPKAGKFASHSSALEVCTGVAGTVSLYRKVEQC